MRHLSNFSQWQQRVGFFHNLYLYIMVITRDAPSGMGGGRRFSVGGGAPELSMGSTEGRGGETEGNGDYYG